MCARHAVTVPAGALLLLSILQVLLLPAESAAQVVQGVQVRYHSQIPPGDPAAGENFPWTEPGLSNIPNGFCSCSCIDMLFNHFESALHGAAKPWPQREIAAVANTNDSLGGGAHWGTYLSDARRAVHFSSETERWPNTPPSYLAGGKDAPTGYSWRAAGPGGTVFGFVAVDGSWTDNGWTLLMFKSMLAAGWPVMVNVNADSVNASRANGDIGDDETSSDVGWSLAESVDETAVGHSIIVRGYRTWGAPPDTLLFHCPTLGPGKTIDENIFWNSWWTNKEFLFVAPWGTDIDVPALGSFNPNGFEITGTGDYTDGLPIGGTADCDSVMGAIWFYGDEPVAGLAEDQDAEITFEEDVASGTVTDGDWSCVTKRFGKSDVQVETWAVVSMTSDSYSGGYEDFVGCPSDTDSIRVPHPEVGGVEPSICNIPRGPWWEGVHFIHSTYDFSPGMPNDVSVEVDNHGDIPATGVVLECQMGDPTLVQVFGDPLMLPLGMLTLPPIPPGGSVTSTPMPFTTPAGNSFGQPYYNFYAFCDAPEDPPRELWVEIDNNLACRSVHLVQLEPYQGTYIEFHVGNPYGFEAWVEVVLETNMPGDWSAFLGPAGMERVLMAPGEMQTRTLYVSAGSPWVSTFEVREDIYDADNDFIRCTGGLLLRVSTTATGMPGGDVAEIGLDAISPNAGAEGVVLTFALPALADAELTIYDPSGRRVATVYDGKAEAGHTRVIWDGRSSVGSRVASGVYFARLVVGREERTRKIVLVR